MITDVLVLSPYGALLEDTIVNAGGLTLIRAPDLEVSDWPQTPNWVVSFGYRKIIPIEVINKYEGRIINIHLSLLPWNRGAHPNFWSWFDDTPKGVTIHRINGELDKGEILAQRRIFAEDFRLPRTLTSTYDDLLIAAAGLFDRTWPSIVNGSIEPIMGESHETPGSYHRSTDWDRHKRFLTSGLATLVLDVEHLGRLFSGGET